MEELGLFSKISIDGGLQPLPEGTFIGEYKFEDKENLKNLIYTEVKELFDNNGVKARLFVAVSENASIGLEDIKAAPVSQES